MTSCHEVTNLIHLAQLVDELGSSVFFCLHGFVGHWVQQILMIFHSYEFVTSWRHVMTSQKLVKLSQLWIHWKDDRVQDSTVFLVAHSRMLVFMYLWDDIMSWRHVMTSRQYLTSPYSTYKSCSWALLRLLYKFYANLGCSIKQIIDTIFQSCRQHDITSVMTSRCDVMQSYEIEAVLVCFQLSHATWPVSHICCSIVVYYQAKMSEMRFVIS